MFDKKYLVADIGATNTRLAILNNKGFFVKKEYYKNKDVSSINDLIKQFVSKENISYACIAVAGPVSSDRTLVNITNNNWTISSLELSKILKTRVIFLNDLEALGFAMDIIKESDYIILTENNMDSSATISIIAPGTGLGTSIVYPLKNKHYPIPSEGGHSSIFFDPDSKLEIDLFKYMKEKKIPLEAESLITGKGIITIYQFLLSKKIKHDRKVMQEIKNSSEKAELITKYALQDKDFLCLKTLELFVLFLSRSARNLALTSLCKTLFIGGGIAPNILPILKDGFVEAFNSHDRIEIRKILETISVAVITNPDLTLLGAYNVLKNS
ncbi:MAG: glucokinase [Candidatus Woesearchaeota archaeon]|nr:MAG: glucokinase [Candidatus Woesearchaeota archaeon]